MTKKTIAAALGSLGGSKNTPAQRLARMGNLRSKQIHSLLITGGTGTVGSAVVEYYLKTRAFERIVIFSRDEHKQWEMRTRLNDPRLRFFLGDIRDKDRLVRATEGVAQAKAFVDIKAIPK